MGSIPITCSLFLSGKPFALGLPFLRFPFWDILFVFPFSRFPFCKIPFIPYPDAVSGRPPIPSAHPPIPHPPIPPRFKAYSPTLYYKGCHGTIDRYSPGQDVQMQLYVQMRVQLCPHGSGQIKETAKLTILRSSCYNRVIRRHLGGMERIRREFKTDCILETFTGT